MKLVKGNCLSEKQRREVLAAFIYRHLDTTSKDDSEWLAGHAFYIRKDGCLAMNRRYCEPAFMAEWSS